MCNNYHQIAAMFPRHGPAPDFKAHGRDVVRLALATRFRAFFELHRMVIRLYHREDIAEVLQQAPHIGRRNGSMSGDKKRFNDAERELGWVKDGDGQKWSDPFERKLAALSGHGVPSRMRDALIFVNDTLGAARAIALTNIEEPTGADIIAVYQAIVARHNEEQKHEE